MDNGEGRFVPAPANMVKAAEAGEKCIGLFRVGEIVELHGSRFRIATIGPKRLTLKLLARENGSPDAR